MSEIGQNEAEQEPEPGDSEQDLEINVADEAEEVPEQPLETEPEQGEESEFEEISSENESPADFEVLVEQGPESESETEAEDRFFRKILKKSDRHSGPRTDLRFSEFKVKLPNYFRGFDNWKFYT